MPAFCKGLKDIEMVLHAWRKMQEWGQALY